MARDPQTIEREIEQARDALAATLDQLGERANPQKLVEQAKTSVRAQLRQPKVRYPLIGVGVLVGVLVARKLFR
ncbi:MAG TPA: DUF3618 domain-containing protein [Pseudonocardiaceae bacterium]|jgi:hypothetical protein|nr:DUF3618 domain-containing protein [Pseudonocardiaceae bacterium]